MPAPTAPDFYVYQDPNTPPVRIQVLLDGNELCARFVDESEGPCLVPVADMSGDFTRG